MGIEKFRDPNYKSDENTKKEIEKLHSNGESLSQVQLKYADMKNAK